MTGCWSLLWRITIASAVVALATATPALAAQSAPKNAGPDPSPTAGTPIPDPYPGVTRTRPAPVHITPTRTLPVTPAPVVQTPVTEAPVTEAPVTQRPVTQQPVRHHVAVHHKARPRHRVRHVVVVVPVAAAPPIRVHRPEAPAPALGAFVFGTVVHSPTRIPDGAALAVALVVLLSGLFLARTARELAR